MDSQDGGGATLIAPSSGAATDFLAGDVMKRFWSEDSDVATMAGKKKKAPARKPVKKPKKKPRPTRNRPGCVSTPPNCSTTIVTHTTSSQKRRGR